jgi:MFS family permease
MLASIFAGKIANTKGRKLPLQLTSVMLFLTHFASSLAPNYFWFFILRMSTGFFFGVNDNTLLTFVSEVATIEKRALGNALYYLFWGSG